MKSSRNMMLALATAAILGWWFFRGENPVQMARKFVGRGKRLTTSHLNADGSLRESPADLVAQVHAATGRSDISETAVLMARVSASENAGAAEREKTAIQWVLRNDAAAHAWSVRTAVTVNPGSLGKQAGRRYSTAGGGLLGSREIHDDDLYIAEAIERGEVADFTGGATKFIHYTGYKRFVDFLKANPKVQAWIDEDGLEPVFLGGVGNLVVFRSAGVMPDGQPLALSEAQ